MIEDTLHLVVGGYANVYFPYPPFLWSFCLTESGFQEADLFPIDETEQSNYSLTNNVSFESYTEQTKWMVNSNGSFLFVTKGRSNGKELEPWSLKIEFKIFEQGNKIEFESAEGDLLSLRLENGRFQLY